MSTAKVINIVHPSGTTTNIVNDASGNITVGGNVTLSGTAARITGDFSNATLANRMAFQTSTVNGISTVAVLPNGTQTISSFSCYNNATPSSGQVAQLIALSTEMRLTSAPDSLSTYLPMTFHTGGSERMRLDTSGNLGVGTTSPQAKLSVSNAGAAGFEFFANAPGGGTGTYIQSYNRSGAAYVDTYYYAASHTWRANSSSTAMVLDASGNVGIGTSSPAARMDVQSATQRTSFTGTAVGVLNVKSTTATGDYASITFQGSGGYPASKIAYQQTASGGTLSFGTSNDYGAGITNTAMIIDSSGRLLVGQTSSTNGANLSVTQGSAFNGTTYSTIAATVGSYSTTQQQQVTTVSTTFITFLNPGIYGSLVLVWGSDGTNRFFDLVMCSLGTGSVTVVSSMTAGGTPSARSYQQGSSQFQMKVASGTYTVQASAFSIGF
jgi:hypothetical protein